MATGAIYPGYSDSLLSLGNQSSALQLAAIQSRTQDLSPQDVVSITNNARKAHSAADLFDSAGFKSVASAGPASPNSAPFQKVVAAIQYQQVQSLLETGTTCYRPGSVASASG
jgi:hypothetical protein